MIEVPIWLLVVHGLITLLIGTMLWRNLRERPFHVRVPDVDSFDQALPSIAGMTQATIVPGNSVEVLQNGDGFFPRLFADIDEARETIHFETYVWWTGDICHRLADALARRAREGLEVRIMIDAVGSLKMEKSLKKKMRQAGCRVSLYHPLRLKDLGQLNKRTHRKLAIFDGRIGYVFGQGVSHFWEGHGQDAEHWRDTGVRLLGPVVHGVQSVFAQHWVEETGQVLLGEKYFPALPRAGDVRVHVLAGSPLGGVSDLELMFKMAIASAQHELFIQNPYFILDGESVDLLGRAVKRGVKVWIMIPGPVTDSQLVKHAGHFRLGDLLRVGVRLFIHQRTLIHQKVMIIDGSWSHVGSTNLDDRSFDINEESAVGILDEGIAAELKAAFEEDLKSCREMDLAEWAARPLWHKALDRLFYQLNGQL